MVVNYNYNYFWEKSIKLQLHLQLSWRRCNAFSSTGTFIFTSAKKHKITYFTDTETDSWYPVLLPG